jgi:acyl carrier protein
MSVPTKVEILERLQEIFREIFDDKSIVLKAETTASDIPDWDSRHQITIILACERAFGIRLRPREINALENVNEMVEHLAGAIAKQRG